MSFPISPSNGEVYKKYKYNSSKLAWDDVAVVPMGFTANKPASSGKSIIDQTFGYYTPSNGIYYITVNGVVTQVYCDMVTSGGGWMLAYKIPATSGGFDYNSTYWTTNNSLNTTTFDIQVPSKYNTANYVSFSNILLVTQNTTTLGYHSLVVPVSGSSLISLFSGVSQTLSLTDAQWLSLFPEKALTITPNRKYGINANAGGLYSYCRIGIVGDEADDSYDPDTLLGFGNSIDHPWGIYPNCGGGNAGNSLAYNGWIFIR